MGDRANFGIRQDDKNVIFIYGHWAGEGMLANFANALEKVRSAGRITDSAYATRIIFDSLTKGQQGETLGWGITANGLADNEHSIPVYDTRTATVTLFNRPAYDQGWAEGGPKFTMNLDNFIAKFSKVLV